MIAPHIALAAPAAVPFDVLLATIPSLPRPFLAKLTQRLIDRLDDLDGDTDIEPNGDELDGTGGEDDFADRTRMHGSWHGAGCPISDPPEDGDADRCTAGDDDVYSGPGVGYHVINDHGPGDVEDAEHDLTRS